MFDPRTLNRHANPPVQNKKGITLTLLLTFPLSDRIPNPKFLEILKSEISRTDCEVLLVIENARLPRVAC